MGLFDKLFGKKKSAAIKSSTKTISGANGSSSYQATIHSDGRVTGAINAHTGFGTISVPINTTVSRINSAIKSEAVEKKALLDKYGRGNVIDLGNGMVRVKKAPFVKKYMQGAILSDDIFWMDEDVAGYITILQNVIDDHEARRKEHIRKEKRLARCVELNNRGIQLEKEGKLDAAIDVYEENISGKAPYPAAHSYDRLIVLYGKRNDVENKKRVLRMAVKTFSECSPSVAAKYNATLIGLDATPQYPTVATVFQNQNETLGSQLLKAQKKLPEFKFYSSESEPPTFSLDEVHRHQREFRKLTDEASRMESEKRFDEASKIYEKLISEECISPIPYDNLIKIYVKAGLIDDAKRVCAIGIAFFSKLRKEQYDYVDMLAKKYGKYDFWQERVKDGKRITYYNGCFDLYNPFKHVERWESKLKRMK